MEIGFVYILTNPCLDGWVKIGMTERDDIESRLRDLFHIGAMQLMKWKIRMRLKKEYIVLLTG